MFRWEKGSDILKKIVGFLMIFILFFSFNYVFAQATSPEDCRVELGPVKEECAGVVKDEVANSMDVKTVNSGLLTFVSMISGMLFGLGVLALLPLLIVFFLTKPSTSERKTAKICLIVDLIVIGFAIILFVGMNIVKTTGM